MRNLLFVFEFPPGESEWQNRDVADALRRQHPGLRIDFCSGWYAKYQAGGMRPGRIANCAWVHVRAFFQILFGRHDVVFVRSAPPLIQMTVALACKARGTPYWIWLMDAHPEIEREILARVPGVGLALAALVKLNGFCLRGAQIVIVLDEGMRERLVPTLPDQNVIVCPTWGRSVKAA